VNKFSFIVLISILCLSTLSLHASTHVQTQHIEKCIDFGKDFELEFKFELDLLDLDSSEFDDATDVIHEYFDVITTKNYKEHFALVVLPNGSSSYEELMSALDSLFEKSPSLSTSCTIKL
jgi:hypothetical protein